MTDSTTEMVAMVAGSSRGLDILKTDKGPTWDGKKTTYKQWYYEFWAFLCLCGLGPTVKGTNRAEKTSEDAKIALAYERLNLYLWRLIIRAISKDSAAGRALMLLIQDEYGQDLDGFDLLRYLARYANDQSAEDVKRRKAKIDDGSWHWRRSTA